MRDGISGANVPAAREYAAIFDAIGTEHRVAPLLLCAIRLNETSEGFPPNGLQGGADPESGLMPDGSNAGHGIMQLTSSFPSDWADPEANIEYAAGEFVAPDWERWVKDAGLQGEGLIRAIAASYNAGFAGAWRGHLAGDVDQFTTNRYGDRALAHFKALEAELEVGNAKLQLTGVPDFGKDPAGHASVQITGVPDFS